MNRAKGFIDFIEMANKSPHLDSSTKRQANDYLYTIGKEYHKEIPLGDILKTLEDKFGIVVLQEDNTRWSGLLIGPEGSMNLPLAKAEGKGPEDMHVPYNNSMLAFQWYQMESGNYEINAYLS